MGTIVLILIILLVIGALPTWPYSSGWGYYPSGGVRFAPYHRFSVGHNTHILAARKPLPSEAIFL
jgi:hypothetical protein